MNDISELATAAIQLHELFREFTRAGFTEDQALRLTAYLNRPEAPGAR